MVTRTVKGLCLKALSPSHYELTSFPSLVITIRRSDDNTWFVIILQPKGDQWEVTTSTGYSSLEHVIDSIVFEEGDHGQSAS